MCATLPPPERTVQAEGEEGAAPDHDLRLMHGPRALPSCCPLSTAALGDYEVGAADTRGHLWRYLLQLK